MRVQSVFAGIPRSGQTRAAIRESAYNLRRVPVVSRAALLGMIIALTAGCGRSGFEIADPDGLGRRQPLPNFPGGTDPTATATPSPTATPPVLPDDSGDGRDGSLNVSAPLFPTICTSLVSGQDTHLDVANPIGFTAGTRVLVMQVQDAFVAAEFDPGPISVLGSAGRWEIVQVASGTAGITLSAPMYWSYSTTATRAAQACILPQYDTLTVTGSGALAAAPWDGITGGVVAFFAQTLTLGGAVSADAAGFRGGVLRGNSASSVVLETTPNNGDGAGKGEGLDPGSFTISGRGNWANGAGGGNGACGGGGGGGNGGAGGLGGRQRTGQGVVADTAGRPGAAVTGPIEDRLVLGGGGGGGHKEFGNPSFAGGRGGGAVLVFASTLTGNGTIHANGASVAQADFNGVGGGGAGGSILVRAVVDNFTGTVRAVGGVGGNVANGTNTPRGAGGGGGGGRIRLVGVTPSTTDAGGGASGTNVSSSDGVTSNGALAGSIGVIE